MSEQKTPTKRMSGSVPRPVSANETKENYRLLKRRFKFLVYENECYQEEIRNLQRKLLKLSRDKNFLLDRLIQYEKLSDSSDDSDASVSRQEERKPKKKSRPSATRRNRNQNVQVQQQQAQGQAMSMSNATDGGPMPQTSSTSMSMNAPPMQQMPMHQGAPPQASQMQQAHMQPAYHMAPGTVPPQMDIKQPSQMSMPPHTPQAPPMLPLDQPDVKRAKIDGEIKPEPMHL